MIEAPKTLLGQIVAYAIGGGAMTGLHAATYWVLAQPVQVEPYLANLIAALVAGFAGFELHSRWTFGNARQSAGRGLPLFRYAAVSVLGFALNSFWVWLVVKQLSYSVTISLLPMVFISPWVAFFLNRHWTFKSPG